MQKYLHQVGFRYSQIYASDVLVKNSKIAKCWLGYLKLSLTLKEYLIERINSWYFWKNKEALQIVTDASQDAVVRVFFSMQLMQL